MADEHASHQEAEAPTPSAQGDRHPVTLSVPPIDRLFVLLGGCALVASGLLSWIEVEPETFPNFAGAGPGGMGIGLVAMLAGLLLLSNRLPLNTAMGVTLGTALISLIAVLRLTDNTLSVEIGAGAWVALVGSVLALAGVSVAAMTSANRPHRHVGCRVMAAGGAGLAVIASVWMDWSNGVPFGFDGSAGLLNGLDGDVVSGYPVLILSVIVLLVLLAFLSPTISPGVGSVMASGIRVAGITVGILAAADVVGLLMNKTPAGSGPILALIGAAMMIRSVGSVPADQAA